MVKRAELRPLDPFVMGPRFGGECFGPLTGVRFWMFDKNNKIHSFQCDHKWSPEHATVDNEPDPTIENERGINVYKSVGYALRGSADAVNDVIEHPTRWLESGCGIVLGEVEFWGPTVECQNLYAAKIVKPTRFLRAWGARADTIVAELNALWFPIPQDRRRKIV